MDNKSLFQNSPDNRLTYAIDSEGKLVSVDDVLPGNKCRCFCPACKAPLIAKNQGLKRGHHFAHQNGTECKHAFESMLHILAKEKVRDAFLSKTEFWIKYKYRSFCPDSDTCKFLKDRNCYSDRDCAFDIKQYYDSCEQEIAYDGINRRSDLKIFSSKDPKRHPIYLEFCVTHESDSEKLHSGNKIIEIKITSERDVLQLADYGIIESGCYNSGKNMLDISFYGFKNRDYSNNLISNEIEFVRFILYESGKMRCFQDSCDCRRLVKSANSLFEVCIHTSVSFGIYDKAKYIAFQKFGIPNCTLCKNWVNLYNRENKICRFYKILQIPKNETFDTSRAKKCSYFKIDKEEQSLILGEGLNVEYTILTP